MNDANEIKLQAFNKLSTASSAIYEAKLKMQTFKLFQNAKLSYDDTIKMQEIAKQIRTDLKRVIELTNEHE